MQHIVIRKVTYNGKTFKIGDVFDAKLPSEKMQELRMAKILKVVSGEVQTETATTKSKPQSKSKK